MLACDKKTIGAIFAFVLTKTIVVSIMIYIKSKESLR